MADESFVFLDDSKYHDISHKTATNHSLQKTGKILTVDDDLGYQKSLLYGLRDFVVNGDVVEILTANSAAEAASVIAQNEDIAIILLDVVMEQDDAGLRLVETIRNIQGNALVRIILLTGQPGIAPRKEVMEQYDIDEYWNKSEISHDTLKAVITANLRSWQSMLRLEQARTGLQMVVDASRHLASKYDTNSFIQVVLKEIGKIIGDGAPLTHCVIIHKVSDTPYVQSNVIASTGTTAIQIGAPLPNWFINKFDYLCRQALSEQHHQFDKNKSVLYFPCDRDTSCHYLVMAETQHALNDYHINLLQVFSENISSGFMQIALVNQLTKLAYQDSELQIYNRNWLLRELHIMNNSDRNKSELVIISVDNFDSQALAFSEEYLLQLIEVTYKNILQLYKHTIGVARIGTSTFAVLYNSQYAKSNEMLQNFTNQSHEIQGEVLNHTLTIARLELSFMQSFPALQILHLAESMLYYARQRSIDVLTYGPWYRERLLSDYQILSDLKKAITNNEFFLVLQPKVDLRTGAPVGMEALLRWRRDGEIVPPGIFIPIAEDSGLITKLDLIAARLSIDTIQKLELAGYKLPVSFNATVKDLSEPGYIQLIQDALNIKNVSPELLDVEITETQAMESYEKISPILAHLHSLGVHISIDDFGTGYSSLSHISKLAADTIKIDMAFVTNLSENKADQQVVELVMNLASLFGFTVVAEGIETELQRDALLAKGCYIGQGFFYAKPMELDELFIWLNNHLQEK